MKIIFLTVGKTDAPFVKEGLEMYEKRIRHYIGYQRIEIPELKGVGALGREQIKEKEGELILKQISDRDEVILLDERGEKFTSVTWAQNLEKKMASGIKNLFFVVGGAYGFSEKVYQRSNGKLSLSDMTFSHQIIRVFFAEQLYRAFTIIKGEPYHNE